MWPRRSPAVAGKSHCSFEKFFAQPSLGGIEVRKRVWLLIQWPEARLEEPSSAIIAVDLIVEAHKDGHEFSGDKNQPTFLVFTAGSDLDGLQNDHGAKDLLRFVRVPARTFYLIGRSSASFVGRQKR